jgi:hypothetical protein
MNGMAAGEAWNTNLVGQSSQARGFLRTRAAKGRREANDRGLVPTNGPLFKALFGWAVAYLKAAVGCVLWKSSCALCDVRKPKSYLALAV